MSSGVPHTRLSSLLDRITDPELRAAITSELRLSETSAAVIDVDAPVELRPTGSIVRVPGRPAHLIIEGENADALDALTPEFEGQVDLVFIDPPYNTKTTTWTYNDRYDEWLEFMELRLRKARRLLKPSGILIAAIGDHEHHRLRVLLDDVFGRKNFVADVVWTDKGSNLSKFTTGGTDYMLMYAVDADQAPAFREPKPHAPQIVAIGRQVADGTATRAEAEQAVREYIRRHKADLPKGISDYRNVDGNGRVYGSSNIDNGLYRPNLRYPITDPVTGKTFQPPANGWTAQASTMDRWISEDRILFTGVAPRRKQFLDEALDSIPNPVFTSPRGRGTQHLQKILGAKRFPFPKDHEVLMRWIRMAAPADGIILDFFGGSGSTAEAVMRLNAEHSGTRQAILITNNELSRTEAKKLTDAGHQPGSDQYEAQGVFRNVTRPRIETIVTGVREDGSRYSDGLDENVDFLEVSVE